LADNNPTNAGPPEPNVEVAGVAARMRIRFDLSEAVAQLKQELPQAAEQAAQEIAASLDQAGTAVVANVARSTKGTLAEIEKLRAQLAINLGRMADLGSQREAIALEASALHGLLEEGRLMAAQADTAKARLDALKGDLEQVEAAQRKLNGTIGEQTVAEQRLSRARGETSQVPTLRQQLQQPTAISGQAQVDAYRRVNALLSESDRERLAEQRRISAQETQIRAERRAQDQLDIQSTRERARVTALQGSITTGAGQFGGLETEREALEREAGALKQLADDGTLARNSLAFVQDRLKAIDGELAGVTEKERVLSAALLSQIEEERRLASLHGLQPQGEAIVDRTVRDEAIAAQARIDSTKRVNAVIAASNQERLAEERRIAAEEAAIERRRVQDEKDAASKILDQEKALQLAQSRIRLESGFNALGTTQTRGGALALEGSGIQSLMAAGKLTVDQTLQAQARLREVETEFARVNSLQKDLTRQLDAEVGIETRLSEAVGQRSQAEQILTRSIDTQANAARAEEVAYEAINRLLDQQVQKQGVLSRVKNTAVDALGQASGRPADSQTLQQFQARAQAAGLSAELEKVRQAQRLLEAEYTKGSAGARDQASAWSALERRGQLLERQIASLNARTQSYETQTKRSLGSIIPLWDRLTRTTEQRGGGSALLTGLIGGVAGAAAFQGLQLIETGFKTLTDTTIGFNARLETASVGLRQFVQNGQGVKILTDEFLQFATASPFGLDQILEGSRRLLAMGTAADRVLPTLRTISATVASLGGNSQIFERIVLALTQIGSKAVLQAQDLRQLAEAGVPVYKILEQQLGLTSEQVQNIGKAAIDSKRGLDALVKGLDERFGQGILLSLDTFQGRLQNLGSVFQIFAGKLGQEATGEFKKGFEQMADLLQDPGTLRSAEALGSVIGQMVRDLRENIFADQGGLLSFLREFPNLASDLLTKGRELEAFLSDFKGLDINLEGKPLINFGEGPARAAAITAVSDQINEEAQKIADQSAKTSKLQLDLVAEVRTLKLDAARATVKPLDTNVIDFSPFKAAVSDDTEKSMLSGLTDGGLQALDKFLTVMDKELSDNPVGAHIGAQIRETLLAEIAKLGDSPSAEAVNAAVARLGTELKIPGVFEKSNQAKEIIAAAQATLQLAFAQDKYTHAQQASQDLQDKIRWHHATSSAA
jgi:tape measure domain-containing protein